MPVTAAPRIACLSTYAGHAGGAAVAMQRLVAALEAEGATVDVIARHRPDQPAARGAEEGSRSRHAERRIRRRIRHGRTPLSNTLFSADWPAWDVASHPAVRAADVIHVHWVAGFLDAAAVRRLVAAGKPVVWTQHDFRAFTGGCHYPAGCAEFAAECNGCPQLAASLAAVPERSLRRSRRLLRGLPLAFVSPSRWLADELARASLFDATCHALHVIPNGIDVARYAPAADKAATRARLGLPAAGLAVILGSVSLDERRKGARTAAAALTILAARLRSAGAPPPVAITCGAGTIALPGITHRHLGTVDEAGMLAALQACDVHVTMAREDNLPNTVVEALACGLPVVACAVGGLPEMVTTGVEGWLVPVEEPAAAATALASLARDPRLLAAAARAARSRAVAVFDSRLQAARHLALYEDLLRRPARGLPRPAPGGLLAPSPATVPLLAPPPLIRRCLRHLRRLSRIGWCPPRTRSPPR